MLIVSLARVRYFVIGAVGKLVIFNEHMIGKWSVGEIGKEKTEGDKVIRGYDSIDSMRMSMSWK